MNSRPAWVIQQDPDSKKTNKPQKLINELIKQD
jgi:hypothetical protein